MISPHFPRSHTSYFHKFSEILSGKRNKHMHMFDVVPEESAIHFLLNYFFHHLITSANSVISYTKQQENQMTAAFTLAKTK